MNKKIRAVSNHRNSLLFNVPPVVDPSNEIAEVQGSMQQIRHKSFEQNPCLINISAKKCRPLGMPSQQGIDHKRDKRDR
jgi:hypothetical protein